MTVDHKRFFDVHPDRYDRLLGRERWPRNQEVKARFIAEALGAPVGVLLDVGCGTGQLAELLLDRDAAREYVGLDPAPAMLDRARTRLARFGDRVRLLESFAERIELPDDSVDAAFGVDLLHHLTEPVRALEEIRRLLRPGGRVVFLESNPRYPLTFLIALSAREERGMFRTGERYLHSLLERAGFSDVRVENVPLYTPPGPRPLVPLYDRIDRTIWRARPLRRVAIFFRASGVA